MAKERIAAAIFLRALARRRKTAEAKEARSSGAGDVQPRVTGAVLLAALLLAGLGHGCHRAPRQAVQAVSPLPTATVSETTRVRKPVMVIVTAVWCGGCRQLKEQVLSRPDVRASAKRFVCLEVDGDNQADLKKRLNVSGYPTIVFFDSSGRESSRVQGAVPYQMLLREMDSAAHSAS